MSNGHDAAAALADRIVSVRDLATFDLVDWLPGDAAAEAADHMQTARIDVAPVRETPVSRFVSIDDLRAGATVDDCARQIELDMVIAADAPLSLALRRLVQRGHLFVLTPEGVSGILSQADLQRPVAGMPALAEVVSLERALDLLIPIYSDDEWWHLLDEKHQVGIDKVYANRLRHNAEISKLECLDLLCRFLIVLQLPDLRVALGFSSKKTFESFKRRTLDLRDRVAHGGGLLAMDSPEKALDAYTAVRHVAQVAWRLAEDGAESLWDAYLDTVLEIDSIGSSVRASTTLDGTATSFEGTGHVITAHNPRSRVQGDARNSAANDRLAMALDRFGVDRSPATGRSAHGSWAEVGFFVEGLARVDAVDLGRRFGQRAIFELAEGQIRVIDCESGEAARTAPSVLAPR